MTLHVCQDGHKWYVQEDPESETYIAEFSSEQAAESYVKSLENPQKKMTKIISETREESKCDGCNWEASTFYSFDTDIKEDKESWLCGSCMLDLVVENNYDIDTRGIEA